MLCKKPYNGHGCGSCRPCRINLKRIWSSRIMLESETHGDSAFLTLTYNDENCPVIHDGKQTLDPNHLRDFWKRLRKAFPHLRIRYYAVGEYGDDSFRPHYHAALFGLACLGKIQRPETGLECHCSHCQLVKKKWTHGNVTLDDLVPTSAAYIAGYVIKKMTSFTDPRLEGRHPEFSRQSQGIARDVVPDIVESLLSEYGHLAFQNGDIPHTFLRGNSSIPLGRYLRSKIRKGLDLYKVNPDTGEITYGAPYETLEILQAQKDGQAVFDLRARLRDPSETNKKALYAELDTLRKLNASKVQQRIKNLEAKFNIYQQKGKSL